MTSAEPLHAEEDLSDSPNELPRLYDTAFWLTYLANFLLVTANALLFRFAEFVEFLGGTAGTAGLVVGCGMGGSIALRLYMGRCIDRYGPRWVWLSSAAMFAAACAAFVPLRALGPGVYLVRLVFNVGMAGMFACSFVFICARVPATRRAEFFGILGTSGFFGMMVGPQLGDLLFHGLGPGHEPFAAMFLVAAGLGAAYLVVVWFATRRSAHLAPEESPPLMHLLLRYWPGALVVVALAMGLAQTVPQTFLALFASHHGFSGLRSFFLVYASTAFVLRVVGRHWPQRMGRGNAILLGLSGTATSMVLYLTVGREGQLVVPALVAGAAHALLFPSAVSLGADAFPDLHRGTGITLLLGFIDLGMLVGAPVLGGVVDYGGFSAMFVTAALVIASAGTIYLLSRLWQRSAASESGGERVDAWRRAAAARRDSVTAAWSPPALSRPDEPICHGLADPAASVGAAKPVSPRHPEPE
jgi:MFS family permease